MKRRVMKHYESKKVFRRGAKSHRKNGLQMNSGSLNMRGGIRF